MQRQAPDLVGARHGDEQRLLADGCNAWRVPPPLAPI